MAHDVTQTALVVPERSSARLPDLSLSVASPGAETRTVPLGLTPLVVGSGPDAAIVLEDDRVSRVHCEIRLGPEGVVVRDLGSKNGSFIGAVPIKEAFLVAGATLRVGLSTITLVAGGRPRTVALHDAPQFGDAVGASVPMRALFAQLERAAASDAAILLLGESGTGKELLAHAIHRASPRCDGPFVIIDCGAIAPSLIESELFGYAKGAFTGASGARVGLIEQADGGTLVLDEIGELALDLQPKLLRVLESGTVRPVGSGEPRPVNVRVIAATHRDLRAMVARRQFREDLFYRLSVVEARVPPLRERKDDVPLLVEHLLARHSPPRTLDDLPPGALDMLRGHDWPGNVRELRNVLQRLVLFPEQAGGAIAPAPAGVADSSTYAHLPLQEARQLALAAFEREYLLDVLRRAGGRVAAAAQAMGVTRQFAYRLFARYDIRPGDE